MPNKIFVLENRKNNKNIENKRGSDMWHKKPYFIYILLTIISLFLFYFNFSIYLFLYLFIFIYIIR